VIVFLVQHPEVLAAALRMHQRRQATSDVAKQLEAMEKDLKAIEKQEKATVEAQIQGLMAGTNTAPYLAVLRDLSDKRERLQQRLSDLQAQREQALKNDPAKTADLLQKVAAIVEELLTSEEVTEARKREIYSSIIEEIEIVPNEAEKTWGIDVLLRSNYPQVSESVLPPSLARMRYTGVNISMR
jgi:hypothetical protein